MSWFQNLFSEEFRGNWLLGDRQYILDFNCSPNKNSSDYQYAWTVEPYDLSSVNTLTFNYAWDSDFKNYSSLAINVAGSTAAATKASEIVALLNANATFASMWVAEVSPYQFGTPAPSTYPMPVPTPTAFTVKITKKYSRPKQMVRMYISNTGAETKLRFNKKSGIADLPLYMERHTIANRFTYSDSVGLLTKLTQPITAISVAVAAQVTSASHGLTSGDIVYIVNTNSTPVIDGERIATVINANNFTVPVTTTVAGTRGEWLSAIQQQQVADAGLDYSTMKEDWELLRGRSGIFNFSKITVDGSNRVTQIIEYPTGAVAGDFAKKINYTYTGANTNPDTTTEIPYVLVAGDLITPP